MRIDDVKNVSVVGAGNMGHQIALQCALYGFKTVSTDVIPEVLQKAEKFCDTYLPGRVEKGKLTEGAAKKARSLIFFTDDLKGAVKDADLVIEAVLERIDLKRKVFADLDKFAPPKAILATLFQHCIRLQAHHNAPNLTYEKLQWPCSNLVIVTIARVSSLQYSNSFFLTTPLAETYAFPA